ncbi:MAG: phosphotransferase [Rhodanobacter sp.]|jgi:aminoglycoside/choline kinase family phosphotransferase|nr:phosphotransferase [Rhodanobacter sp.]
MPLSARKDALRRFAEDALREPGLIIEPASADASFRSYWRATSRAGARIVMDAPPDKENIEPWLDIGARLQRAGLHTPQVYAVDRTQGFVLMEDLGARAYLSALNATTADALYADALDALARMQTRADPAGLPVFDAALLAMELDLMPEWFLRRHLNYAMDNDDRDVIEHAFRVLIDTALQQPQTFVHRDYHSRNLLVIERGADGAHANPGIIDFQDAVLGPLVYDVVSLLRDCYIAWDAERIDAWLAAYCQRLRHAHPAIDSAHLRRWFDLTGLQRHIKVLGIFCRLWYRDGKPQYLRDLPLVWRYTISVARAYRELAPLADLLERALGERDIAQPRKTCCAR